MKKSKGGNEPKSVFMDRKQKQKIKNNNHSNNISSNALDEYGYESYPNMQKMGMNNPFEDIYLGSGEMEDQIQSYKEQLIDAKLKNIKLTNEVQKLKELSKTQMSNFYGGLNNAEDNNKDIQNQTDSMFYKSNNGGNNEHIKMLEEKY